MKDLGWLNAAFNDSIPDFESSTTPWESSGSNRTISNSGAANNNDPGDGDQGAGDKNPGKSDQDPDKNDKKKPGNTEDNAPDGNTAKTPSGPNIKTRIRENFQKSLEAYSKIMKKLVKQQKNVRDVFENSSKGEGMLYQAMDNLALAFADTFKDLKESKRPVSLYQEIMEIRDQQTVTTGDAAKEFAERIGHAQTLKGPNPENMDFFKNLWKAIEPVQTAALINLRSQIVNFAVNYTTPLEALETLENFKKSANLVAINFKKEVEGNGPKKRSSSPSKGSEGERGFIDLGFGKKSGKKSDDKNKGAEDSADRDRPNPGTSSGPSL